jgi:beta-lactamase regulating signal transducer with metallopeptidase domain
MASDLLDLILRANLVLAAGVIAVLLLRGPARAWFGARIAYALWLIPPLAAAMCLVPPRTEIVTVPAHFPAPLDVAHLSASAPPPALVHPTPIDISIALIGAWAGGVLLCLIILALRQQRYVSSLGGLQPREDLGARVFAAASTAIGPALIGVFRPKIITPADFDARFSQEERRIILAHERTHMAHGDPLVNAACALLQCLNWFNPFVHIAVRALRTDQELACDAAVLEAAQSARRPYAEALLKTQNPQLPAPLGCAWPSPTHRSLKERISMLKRPVPNLAQRLLGGAAVAAVIVIGCGAAWTAQPPALVFEAAAAEMTPARVEDRRVVTTRHGDVRSTVDHTLRIEHELEGGEHATADEIREEVRQALEEARSARAEADRELAEARHEMHEAGMSDAQIEQITRQALESARMGLQMASVEIRREMQNRQPGATDLEFQLQVQAQQLAAVAVEMAALEFDGAIDEATRARMEADIDARAAEIEALAARMEHDVDVDVDVDVDLDGGE